MERKVMKTGWKLITMFAVALFMLAVTAGIPVIAEKNSGYTVEFTYDGTEYVLRGDTSVPLRAMLGTWGLDGSVTGVEVSDDTLFSVSNETGEWTVTAHQAFDTTEWMKVTIGGVVYEITVTDSPGSVTVTIDMQGHGTNRTVESGNMTSLEAIVANAFDGQNPTAEGYEFACFSLNPMADNPTEEQVQQVHDSFREATVSEYTTVYVVWRKLYTVTINMQGKGNNRTVKAAYGRWLSWVVDSAFSGQEPTAEGYECAGFSLSATNLNPTEEQVQTGS